MAKSTFDNCKILRSSITYKGDWLSMSSCAYTKADGSSSQWEFASRVTTPKGAKADGVTMIAILKRRLHFDCLILVKQFRPPLNSCTIEFPSGLLDKGETIEEAALRELKEETGFTGDLSKTESSVPLGIDPGASSSAESVVCTEIDGDNPSNIRPQQHLDPDEFIEVLIIPLHELLTRLKAMMDSCVVDSKVYTYALTSQLHQKN